MSVVCLTRRVVSRVFLVRPKCLGVFRMFWAFSWCVHGICWCFSLCSWCFRDVLGVCRVLCSWRFRGVFIVFVDVFVMFLMYPKCLGVSRAFVAYS